MAERRARRVVSGLLAAGLLGLTAACGGGGESGAPVTGITSSDDDGYRGIYFAPDEAYQVPDVTLTDTEGRPFDLATQQKRTLVFFGYTNCPDICQTVMSTIASAVAKLPQADQDKLQVAFVTTDPARDTASVMRRYLDRFDPDFEGVTGSLADIDRLGTPMDIYVEKGRKLPSGGYEVDHSTVVVSVSDARGDLVWTGATSPSDMAADLEQVLRDDAA
ncbi:protein SCO1/2 [Nocardioides scoriae]|uniref:Protein SCO1/2 n=1 Tax=Nocardioides scoriae TaxID=642780 RepID=A0A1H1QJT2_9ACTN|nr:SCO family protein [Nocardioides scoriae]SDS23593.1 protein SCO1/2 [Nocardioides scoriae]